MPLFTKQQVIDAIKFTAEENGGSPLGQQAFLTQTGIRETDWRGKYWARWGDALREAGYAPNEWQAPDAETFLLGSYARFAHDLGRIPTVSEASLRRREDRSFPTPKALKRFGSKINFIHRLMEHCRNNSDYQDVFRLCEKYTPTSNAATNTPSQEQIGFVYLMKSGRYYKIGRTNATGRREYELAIQLPERANLVHKISTDDPAGIEAYWHNRFSDKRKNGEWFQLESADVSAFKRRKFM